MIEFRCSCCIAFNKLPSSYAYLLENNIYFLKTEEFPAVFSRSGRKLLDSVKRNGHLRGTQLFRTIFQHSTNRELGEGGCSPPPLIGRTVKKQPLEIKLKKSKHLYQISWKFNKNWLSKDKHKNGCGNQDKQVSRQVITCQSFILGKFQGLIINLQTRILFGVSLYLEKFIWTIGKTMESQLP